MITVVGLGTEKDDLTARASKALRAADEVLVRTALRPSAEGLKEAGIAFESLDFVYEKSRNFDTLAKNLAAEVVKRAQNKNVCYCVDGGVCEDRAAQILIARGNVAVVEGVPKSARAAARAGICGAYTAVSAYEIGERSFSLPLIVYDIDSRELMGDVKLALVEVFGDEARACYLSGGERREIPLFEADRQSAYDDSTALVIYEIPLLEKKRFSFDDFLKILRRLRAPDGCPWDRVQTHESIRINAIEEAYELVDAIDSGDGDKLCEEAGDVLMQAVFHTLIEEERGGFTVTDMLSGICDKLISRHTHVFGSDRAADDRGALSVWDKNKMKEKGQATYSDAVNDVPEVFPALLRAQKIAKRMSRGGWNFTNFERSDQKLSEELEELRAAYRGGDKAEIAEELGDVLMTLAHIANGLDVNAEQSLLDVVKKVTKRFNAWEKLALADGKDVHKLTDEEWRDYYKRAKDASSH